MADYEQYFENNIEKNNKKKLNKENEFQQKLQRDSFWKENTSEIFDKERKKSLSEQIFFEDDLNQNSLNKMKYKMRVSDISEEGNN